MAVELVTLKTKTRGRNSREIEYQGVGKQGEDGNVETAGVVTDFDSALALVGGDEQKLFDAFAVGLNYLNRQAVLDTDEFAGLLDSIDWAAVVTKAGLKDDEKKGTAIEQAQDTYKRSVRAVAKAVGMDIPDAAAIVNSKMPQRETVSA